MILLYYYTITLLYYYTIILLYRILVDTHKPFLIQYSIMLLQLIILTNHSI